MRTLGTYSYGLYVYHHFFSYYFAAHGTERMLTSAIGSHVAAVTLQGAVGFLLSMLVAWLSYEFYEKRWLQLKRHFETRPQLRKQGT
jgi:peptidoglycan/LPS O-acetylase OafA/YrhL